MKMRDLEMCQWYRVLRTQQSLLDTRQAGLRGGGMPGLCGVRLDPLSRF